MIHGKRFFRTADYASLDKEGRYTILGRVDEMVKINGNRVELAEVESAIKKALSTEFCAVKAFEGKNGTPYLCAYYKGDIWDYGESDDIVSAVYELPSEQTACNNKMNLEILDSRDEFGVMVRYDAGAYERDTAEAFAGLFCKACSELLNVTDHTVSVKELSVFS